MARIHRLVLQPPILNSSSYWASSSEQLDELFSCKFTGGVTTRTATLTGYAEDSTIHKHALVSKDTSINSYGYSPYPLSQYLTWIRTILTEPPSQSPKPIIISLAPASPAELSSILDIIQSLRSDLRDSEAELSRIGVELNTSCPNILGQHPPAYDPPSLIPLLRVLGERFALDPTLTIGLKLAPYVHSGQFRQVVDILASLSAEAPGGTKSNCISFLTCTNTLGSSVILQNQTTEDDDAEPMMSYALPTVTGGLAGVPIHALSLGNVHSFRKLLSEHPDPSLQRISVIGVGGVTSPEAVRRMFHVGATAVACATALGAHGVGIFESLNAGL